MQGGDLRAAESLWTGLIREEGGGDLADAYNNRGIVRVRLGRTEEGLADFEAATELSPAGGRAQWNAYQLYLQEFRLEKAEDGDEHKVPDSRHAIQLHDLQAAGGLDLGRVHQLHHADGERH